MSLLLTALATRTTSARRAAQLCVQMRGLGSSSIRSNSENTQNSGSTTHFGYKTIPTESKESLVKGVFSSVASKYDVMNDAMSLGVHRLWKDQFVSLLDPGRRKPVKCLDVAGGTGDIALRILDSARERWADRETSVRLLDINPDMLSEGQKRFKKTMYHNTPQVTFTLGNAQDLPRDSCPDNEYDLYTIAFGIRNCTDIQAVINEAFRTLKPGGTFACLEFSKVENPLLAQLYDTYSFSVIPMLGSILASDRESYQYLVESIRRFPSQKHFANMITQAGFKTGDLHEGEGGAWIDLWGGIASVHTGRKPLLEARDRALTLRPRLPRGLHHQAPALTTAATGAPAMPPASADLATTWPFLEEGVEHIMIRLHTGVTYSKYMNLYTAVYNYCTSSRLHGSFENSALGSRTGANLMGSDLYNNLTRYFTTHLEAQREKSEPIVDQDLLVFYASEWDRFTTGANYINRLFAYLNRHWVKREKDEGRKNVYQVYILALVQWRDRLFYPIQNKDHKLVVALLKMIEKQRNGETIDTGLVKKVIDSFVSLGLDDNDQNKAQLDVYQKEFQTPFIEATEKYYAHESATFLQEHSVPEYLKKAEERLREEEDRIERYLHFSTRKTLISKCEDVLIREHSEKMQDDFQNLLDYDKDEDLQRMYSLLARIPEGLDPLRKKFEEHVKKAGLAAIAKLQGEAANSPGGEVEPKAYVDALLEVHHKNQETVNRSFRGEAGFVASLDRACRDFVNRNAATGTSSTKSPELLAKHADALLRKNNKLSEEGDLEDHLNKVMTLFKYIEDKDVFQTFYTTKLSKRLIHGVSASDESEASMIAKLKEACGFEYTNKLQRMFTDMQLSKDLTDQFKERMEVAHDAADLDVAFSAMVLGTNFWPLNAPAHNFNIPKNILPTYERFQRYYQSKHSGRKLTWLWNYSKNELRTNYLNQKYILMTSSYQMAVLVQYNENDTLSLEELVTATGIPKELLSQVLAVLVKAKVLVNEETEQYDLNPNFKSKKIRVNLNQPIKAEVKQESSDVLKAVDEDRKYVIQATIVRIMKARKTMKNQVLIQEVTSQISTRFAPRIPDIKKAIDTLLEKEYIERADGQRDVFNYVA
ncbi:Cullin protein [Rhizoctonia solani]|uniref:2-methoxy-6-polyprenyl-1,4-benzoquinol methylase, mitochondrial n=2 Tax=Rhizoctonia solani TaxID=456999 RepID=A0A8H7HEJ0_9AGAM|nr:Cullin protein [Rhizoctonia solani]